MDGLPTQYTPLVGKRFTSFRELAHEMHVADVRQATEMRDAEANGVSLLQWEDDGGRVCDS